MKNFTNESWKLALAEKPWEELGKTEDIGEMSDIFWQEK